MYNILVVEDEDTSFEIIQRALLGEFNIKRASSVSEAIHYTKENVNYDLFLLDVVLPDGDGYQIISSIKEHPTLSHVPCIFLSSKTEVNHKVLGLQLGADDYIEKPFSPVELKARIMNKIMKNKANSGNRPIDFGNFNIDPISQKAEMRSDIGNMTEINLTPIEFKILLHLAQNTNEIFSRESLIKKVWGNTIHIQPRNVDTHITSIRKKLKGYGPCLESIYGSGYRFNPNYIKENAS